MTVCFTGHRPQSLPFGYDEAHPLCLALKERLTNEIRLLILDGATDFYCGMAQGVDMFAAEAVLALKQEYPAIRLLAAIPCPDQAKRWSRQARARYEDILDQCDEKIMVSPHYFNGCMHVRNRYMVDRAEVLLAVYDGSETGGTAATVRYAKQKGLTVIELTL